MTVEDGYNLGVGMPLISLIFHSSQVKAKMKTGININPNV